MTASQNPLLTVETIKPPASPYRPMKQVVLSAVLVVAAYLWLPDWLPGVAFGCVLYDSMLFAAYLALLVRWANGVHTLIEEAQAGGRRR